MKIYVAHSNKSLVRTFELCKNMCNVFGHTVLEYMGEKPYTPDKLLSAERLVICVPDHLFKYQGDNVFYIGKGLFTEYDIFSAENLKTAVYAFDGYSFYHVLFVEITSPNDFVSFARVTVGSTSMLFPNGFVPTNLIKELS